jgi:hypothetical protein
MKTSILLAFALLSLPEVFGEKEQYTGNHDGVLQRTLQHRFPMCQQHVGCASHSLAGYCCPTLEGVMLDCCGTLVSVPVPRPVVVPIPVSIPVHVPVKTPNSIPNRRCSANPKCKELGLKGQCCPTAHGKFLDCCKNTPPPRECSKNAVCARKGLTGDCCPTSDELFLDCCPK